ncbi:MAG: HEAT repeat domain-containing protein [Planctomycetes bacterium]|nr:HEAT repeat domain-containing protein [Planctomycetota bacterium]
MHARPFVPILFAIVLCSCSRDRSAEIDKHLSNLHSDDAVTRRNAVLALGNMGADAVQAVPALARMLNDRNDDIRVTVCQVLGKIGPSAAPALKALENAKKSDPDDRVKEAAAAAIQKIRKG